MRDEGLNIALVAFIPGNNPIFNNFKGVAQFHSNGNLEIQAEGNVNAKNISALTMFITSYLKYTGLYDSIQLRNSKSESLRVFYWPFSRAIDDFIPHMGVSPLDGRLHLKKNFSRYSINPPASYQSIGKEAILKYPFLTIMIHSEPQEHVLMSSLEKEVTK